MEDWKSHKILKNFRGVQNRKQGHKDAVVQFTVYVSTR